MSNEVLSTSSVSQPPPHPNDGNDLLNSERRSLAPDAKFQGASEPEKQEDVPRTQALAPRTRKQIVAGNIQYAALCFCFFISGWNDGSTGPLLPRIQEVYRVRLSPNQPLVHEILITEKRQVSYIIVSLFFVVSCSVRSHQGFR